MGVTVTQGLQTAMQICWSPLLASLGNSACKERTLVDVGCGTLQSPFSLTDCREASV